MQNEKIKILLIEDDPAEADLIMQMLAQQRTQEYTVEHIECLADALALLEKQLFDCILVDLGLPDSQGLETALAVRNQAKLTPVAIITIFDDEETALEALKMDIQDYLVKGEINSTALARSIRYAIQRKNITEKLRESEERFTSFMHHMPVAAWIKDIEGRYVYANTEAERIFAITLDALQGKTDRDIFPEEIARQFTDNDRRTFSEGGKLQTTEVLRQTDGIEHHSIVNKFVVNTPDDKPRFIAGVALDITELMQAENALRESEKKFSRIFDTVPVGITISDLADGRFVEINREGERLSGYRRDEVIGRTSLEFNIWHDPVERARMVDEVLKEGAVRDWEMTFHTKEGKLLQGFFSAVVIEIAGKKHLLSMVSDITERKQAEEALRRNEARLRRFYDSGMLGVFYWNMAGKVIDGNDKFLQMIGYTREDLLSGNIDWVNMTPPEYRHLNERSLEELKATGVNKVPWEKVYRRKDGGLLPVIIASAMLDKERFNGVSFVLDITERKKLERELERFASFPRLNPAPIMELNSDGRVTFCNRAAQDIVGKTCFDSSNPFIPADMPDLLSDLRQQKPGQYIRAVEINGRHFDELVYLAPEFDAVRIYTMDVTERRHLEVERSRLAAVVESSDDAIIAMTLDGIIVEWNGGAEKLYGYLASEIKGLHVSTLAPADRVTEVQQILDKIGHGGVEHLETVRMTKDGRSIPVLLTLSPIKDAAGRVTGASSIAHDITNRKRAEEAVEKANRQLADDLEAMKTLQELGMLFLHEKNSEQILSEIVNAAIIVSNADFGNIQIRDPATSSLRIAAQRGFPQWWLDYWNVVHEGKGACGTALERGGRVIVEDIERSPIFAGTEALEVQLRAGVRAVQCTPLYGRDGTVLGMFSTHYKTPRRPSDRELRFLNLLARQAADFIEQVQLREQLEARATELEYTNRELQTFNYSVAHDLRQPLDTIGGYCQAIKMLCGDRLDQECTGYLKGAYDGITRMNQLIEALLNFSRMAHVELHREPVDLSKLARELAEGLRVTNPQRRVTFRIADDVTVEGDQKLLRLVLDNLLGNAWKYTVLREEAIIEWGSTEIDGTIAYFVRDNGPGFDMADAEKLFQPFKRLPGAEEIRGFGIGLATVERIIRRHGGRIWAEGVPEKGATFWFTLPAKKRG